MQKLIRFRAQLHMRFIIEGGPRFTDGGPRFIMGGPRFIRWATISKGLKVLSIDQRRFIDLSMNFRFAIVDSSNVQ